VVDERKFDDSSFAIDCRKRNRNMKIGISIIAVAIIALGVIFVVGSQGSAIRGSTMSGSTMVLHIHPRLNVTVDGSPIIIPQNIGIGESLWKDHSIDKYGGMQGMAPLHTHDSSGIIHVESNTNRSYTLGQFLDIWGGLNLNGKTVKATIDGKPVSDYRNILLKDKEQINLVIK
jgi:hypothetical protein